MLKKIKIPILLLLFAVNTSSCYAQTEVKYPIPTKSFVKIIKKFKVTECIKKTKKKPKECKTKTYASSGSGAAVFIHNNFDLVMTAGHMCDGNIKNFPFKDRVTKFEVSVDVLDHTNTTHASEVVFHFSGNEKKGEPDLCLLYVPQLNIPKIRLSHIKPKVGDEVISMSAPMGVYHPPTVPIFEGRYSGRINKIAAMVTVPSRPGSSGGPILNNKGQLIGVIFAVSVYTENITLVSNYEQTKKFFSFARRAFSRSKK